MATNYPYAIKNQRRASKKVQGEVGLVVEVDVLQPLLFIERTYHLRRHSLF